MNGNAGAYDHCAKLLRERDRDIWLSCLFLPSAARPHAHALYAFSSEVSAVRERVSDPKLGEIRLQWWREVLEGERASESAAHPVAQALLDTIEAHGLPRQALIDLIEARRFDLYDDPMPLLNDLEGYCGETCSCLFRLLCIILAGGKEPGFAAAAGHAGVAYGLTGILRDLPKQARRGQIYLPGDVLTRHRARRSDIVSGTLVQELCDSLIEMRGHIRRHLNAALQSGLEQGLRPAFMPLALIEPYLLLMEKKDYNPFSSMLDIPQWKRQWTLWIGARRMFAAA